MLIVITLIITFFIDTVCFTVYLNHLHPLILYLRSGGQLGVHVFHVLYFLSRLVVSIQDNWSIHVREM